MYKKIGSILFLSILLFAFSISMVDKSASAAHQDSESLYEKAKLGISDLNIKEMQNILENVDVELVNNSIKPINQLFQLDNVGSSPNVETYATAEILESTEDSQLIAIHTFNDIYLNDTKSDVYSNDIKPLNWSGDIYDHTASVRASATIFVNAKKINNKNMIKFTTVSGKWSIQDSRVKQITNRKLTVRTVGSGEKVAVNDSKTYDLTSNTFERPGNNIYVEKNNSNMGIVMNAKLSTAGSTWNFKMTLNFLEDAYR